MNSKNVLLTIVAILMAVVIGGELCVYFGYDLYHSENGILAHPTNPVECCADANPKTMLPNDT